MWVKRIIIISEFFGAVPLELLTGERHTRVARRSAEAILRGLLRRLSQSSHRSRPESTSYTESPGRFHHPETIARDRDGKRLPRYALRFLFLFLLFFVPLTSFVPVPLITLSALTVCCCFSTMPSSETRIERVQDEQTFCFTNFCFFYCNEKRKKKLSNK